MSDTTAEYTVRGMTCGSCAAKVSAAVSRLPGVTSVDVDISAGTLRVAGPGVEDGTVRAAVTDAGYQVD